MVTKVEEIVENGTVYRVTTADTYTEKVFVGAEYYLEHELIVEDVGTDIHITGIVYEKHYKNGEVPITADVLAVVNRNELNAFSLKPVNGVVEVDILLQGVELVDTNIVFKDTSNDAVCMIDGRVM